MTTLRRSGTELFALGGFTLQALDLTSPPDVLGSILVNDIFLPRALAVHSYGESADISKVAFVGGRELRLYDVSDPLSISEIATPFQVVSANTIIVYNNPASPEQVLALVLAANAITIIDVTDPSSPQQIAQHFNVGGFSMALQIASFDSVILHVGSSGSPPGQASLRSYEIFIPELPPILLGTVFVEGGTVYQELELIDQSILVGGGEFPQFITAFDVTQAGSPVEIASVRAQGPPMDFAIWGNQIITASGNAGIVPYSLEESIIDVGILSDALLGLITTEPAYDVNDDGRFDVADLVLLVNQLK